MFLGKKLSTTTESVSKFIEILEINVFQADLVDFGHGFSCYCIFGLYSKVV